MTDPRRTSWRAHRLPAATTTSGSPPARTSTRMRHSAVYTPPPASWLTLTGEGLLAFTTTVNTTLPLTSTGTVGLGDTVNSGLALTGAGSLSMGYSTNLDLSSVGAVGFTARPNVTLAETGAGTVSFTASPKPALPLTGAGTVGFATTVNTTLALTGAGTLGLAAAPAFLPSGMTKNGTQALTYNAYVVLTSWTANTTTYPGTTLSGNGLVANGTKSGATLTTNVQWSGAFSGSSLTVQILVNNTLVATGSAVSGASGTATATTTYSISAGDVVTVQAKAGGSPAGSVSSGTGTFVTIT